MNKLMGRAKLLIILVLILALGLSFFVGEYFLRSGQWILFPGSPHVYNAGNLGCGVVADRDGVLLLDIREQRQYAQNQLLRSSVMHWLGDRQGNISAPALSHYAPQIAGFDPVSGVYAYGGTGGEAKLTLSAQLQIAALEAMGEYKGTLAIYNYQTGEILCAVTTPTYDPDNMPDILGDTTGAYSGAFVNRFTQSAYTPGSIFKIVTAAAALEHIPDIQEQTFTCSGVLDYGNEDVTCEQAHGTLSFRQAFSRSCNCAFAQIADQLGGKVLEDYVQKFGVLNSVSFDGITTAAGKIQAAGQAPVSIAWSAIGQHMDLVNPCAYLRFVGAIANGGVTADPHIVSSIEVGLKQTYEARPGRGERIMAEQTALILQDMLRCTVRDYYGDDSFPGLTVCAKSGTAEVGTGKKPNAMFTGFLADAEMPLAFIVCIEDGGYGRQTCVPVLLPVLQTCKQILSAS